VRDFFNEEIDEVLCDDREAVERMNQLVEKISRRARNRLKFYDGATPIFEALGIQKTNRRRVSSAGLAALWRLHRDRRDRSAGGGGRKHRPKQRRRDVEKTILQTNLEAADEIARQLRLRNIGGLIIADFIDHEGPERSNRPFSNLMKERLRRDKAKTHVLPISQLGLMEMTRQRAQESLSDTITKNCPYCGGRGVVKTSMTTSVELHRTLNTVMRKYQDNVHDFRVILNPDVLKRLKEEDEELLIELERRYAGRLMFRGDARLIPGTKNLSSPTRTQARSAAKHQSAGVTPFELNQQFFVLFLQSLQHVRIQDDAKIVYVVLIFTHHSIERPMQFHTGGHGSFDDAATAAVKAIFVNRIA